MSQDSYTKIRISRRGKAVVLSFNRPEVRNAFDIDVLKELRRALGALPDDPAPRALILTGEGTSFCAGADIRWMRESLDLGLEKNFEEARELSGCLYDLYSHPLPVIAAVNGPAMGGGVGFVAACDIAVAVDTAFFAFSEVRVGVIPACISPYVLKRVGETATRELFLTGDRIGAKRALEIGLVNCVVGEEAFWDSVDELVGKMSGGAPGALRASKNLIETVTGSSLEEAMEYTARLIAELRVSPEGQEGLQAFLEKRKPDWQD